MVSMPTPPPCAPRRVLALTLLVAIGACGPVEEIRERITPETAREAYIQNLADAGLDSTALGRDWVVNGEHSLRDAPLVTSPFREVGYLAVDDAQAVALRVSAERGQRIDVDVSLDTDPRAIVFLDAFRAPRDSLGEPDRIASADEEARTLSFEARRGGEYIVRVQPELLRGGRYMLSIVVGPSLAFPVEGADNPDIGSVFGDNRDGGRRSHHGVDIFADRGTPVLSASQGVTARVRITPRGGKVVWVRDQERGLSLYYAHLDSQHVASGTFVRRGDTLGFVGNTGNARTTPPHLHFGIYRRGEGPVDPQPFVASSHYAPPDLAVDTAAIGRWTRASTDGLRLRAAPAERATALAELPRHTAVHVLAAAGAWYRVRLPDGTHGFIAGRHLEPADVPIGEAPFTAVAAARERPTADSYIVGEIVPGAPVPILGRFGDYVLVSVNGGRPAWLPADGRGEESLAAPE